MTDNIHQAARMVSQSSYMVALTGAGISTPSGIPDFRSHDSGIWQHEDPNRVASLLGFRYQPDAFYRWIRPLAITMLNAEPNPAHLALAQLERMGLLRGIITQNIDMLHTRAGSQTVWEVHGHVRQMTCIDCFHEFDAAPIFKAFLEAEEVIVPRCSSCQGVLKPDVILFGEQLPMHTLLQAQQAMARADLMLVAGSSLEVYPVADFPRRVRTQGGHVIIVNKDRTSADELADIVIHGDVADVLPAIVHQLEKLASE